MNHRPGILKWAAAVTLALSTAPATYFYLGDRSSCCFAEGELNYWWREPTWWRESTIALLGRVGLIAAVMSATVLVIACVRGQLQRRPALGIVALGAIGFVVAASYREATAGGIGALIGIQLVPIIAVVVVFGLVVAAYRLMSGERLRPTSTGRDHAQE